MRRRPGAVLAGRPGHGAKAGLHDSNLGDSGEKLVGVLAPSVVCFVFCCLVLCLSYVSLFVCFLVISPKFGK